MNDKVQVVGHASGKTPTEVAFLWDRGIMLAPTYNGLDSYAFDINNSGQFVGASWGRFPGVYGSTPYLWDGTNLIWLPFIELPDDPYPHYHFGSANGINDRGQIVGSDSGYALLWDDGRVVPLGVVGSGLGINNGGQVVGIESSGSYGLGFMWDGSVHSLTDLLDESAVGWTITWAADINDRGQIAATALGPDGLFHAVRLDPTSLLFLDIRPGNEANKINPKSKGRLAVALLSTPAFNVFTQIDQLFLTFGRTGDETSLAFCDFTPMDVNGDGLPDLVCHFYTETTGFQPGDIQGVMKAKTVSGLYMAGSDSVRTVPPK